MYEVKINKWINGQVYKTWILDKFRQISLDITELYYNILRKESTGILGKKLSEVIKPFEQEIKHFGWTWIDTQLWKLATKLFVCSVSAVKGMIR